MLENFGLYRERIGSCSQIAKDANTANVAQSVLLYVVRCSTLCHLPTVRAIVETILDRQN